MLASSACAGGGGGEPTIASCFGYTSSGAQGSVSFQQAAAERAVAWGIRYTGTSNVNWFIVDVLVNGRRVDGKAQNYDPHGSVNPVDFNSGDTISLDPPT